MEESIKELLKYLQIGARLDLKTVALTHVLGLTGSKDSLQFLQENQDFSELLFNLISLLDDHNELISKDASLTLINISATEEGGTALVKLDMSKCKVAPLQKPPDNIISTILRFILDPNSHIADPCCMILSNLTRVHHLTDKIVDLIEGFDSNSTFNNLINAFTQIKFNCKGANLHYLGPVLSNLTQSHSVRKYILDKDKCVIQRLLPFTEFKESIIRRGGIIGTLKNCCFETEYHSWLLDGDVDILPRLLIPLAGNTEYDEEDNDKLPLELQYLPEDKKREDDPDLRCMLLEAITQLCARRENREIIRGKNTYVILRELHKWEKDKKALAACENLVDLMIRTEEEIGEDDLKELEVPPDLQEKFQEMDQEALEG